MREACDCDRPHSRAAAEKLPSRATREYRRRAKLSLIIPRFPPERAGMLLIVVYVFDT